MSKIPQGEWSAIAARYQNGESISKIARSYGCTPPAIHYILKRHRGSAVAANLPAPAAPQPAAVNGSALVEPAARQPQFDRVAAPALVRTHAAPLPAAPMPASEAAGPIAESRRELPRAAPTPGLDSELHDRAEAAIEIFRTSFDAALIEGSPGVRERLRQAAADLMRVAARTTIVLDQVSGNADRIARTPNYPRSAHTR
jgi:transposase-like protein